MHVVRHNRRHRARPPRPLAVSEIAKHLHMSPNDVLGGANLLAAAAVIRPYSPKNWRVVDRSTGEPVAVAPIAPWRYRPAELRPDRPMTLWLPLERCSEAYGKALWGSLVLAEWLKTVRGELARWLTHWRNVRTVLRSYERITESGEGTATAVDHGNAAGHGPPLRAPARKGPRWPGVEPRPGPQDSRGAVRPTGPPSAAFLACQQLAAKLWP